MFIVPMVDFSLVIVPSLKFIKRKKVGKDETPNPSLPASGQRREKSTEITDKMKLSTLLVFDHDFNKIRSS
jgi:hypothetical protein